MSTIHPYGFHQKKPVVPIRIRTIGDIGKNHTKARNENILSILHTLL